MSDLKKNYAFRAFAVIGVLVLSGCAAVQPERLGVAELTQQREADMALIFEGGATLDKPLTIEEAINRVLSYNLDARSQMMEEALALGQTDLDKWDLLPVVTARAGYDNRSEQDATRSSSSSSYSFSSDRISRTADLSVTWNVLDFGASYFTAHQNADKVLIAHERRRKTVNNLIRETQYAFWRAAVSQMLAERVRKGVADAEGALNEISASSNAGARNPIDALRLRKTLLESLRQLENIDQELSTAKVELAALINLPPAAEYTLDIPADGKLGVPDLEYGIEQMEEMAFLHNPDILEQGYQSRIAVAETKKALFQILPGISLTAGSHYDGNYFLDQNHWYTVGTSVSMNLFNLLSAPARIEHAEAAKTLTDAKRLAIRMAVLAQVHVASIQFDNAKKQYGRADELWLIEQKLEEQSLRRAQSNAQSAVDRVVAQTSAIAAELQRYQLYAKMQAALANIRATIGETQKGELAPAGAPAAAAEPAEPAETAKTTEIEEPIESATFAQSLVRDLGAVGAMIVSPFKAAPEASVQANAQ